MHFSSSTMILLPLFHLTILQFIILYNAPVALGDPKDGFTSLPLSQSNFVIHKPYDVAQNQRYSFVNGVHKFFVFSTDKPFQQGSDTKPRTEIRVQGYDYSSGVWQFEGEGYVPSGSTGVCIMQVFGASSSATTLQVRVYDGSLTSYRAPVLSPNIYNRWFRLNVIHDVDASNVKIYIDGTLKYQGSGKGGSSHYFKFGVYEQNDPSNYMESALEEYQNSSKELKVHENIEMIRYVFECLIK
ncbi:Citrate-binding protein [Quillaja saponaria]|uniref:Citrate-binding protein n=1 Tax=Quillaja saponaria TaxID=32244 RepID=A0AAD7M2I8_QUISA|nr:Citrate-binding protein [Quillaja saponaria]